MRGSPFSQIKNRHLRAVAFVWTFFSSILNHFSRISVKRSQKCTHTTLTRSEFCLKLITFTTVQGAHSLRLYICWIGSLYLIWFSISYRGHFYISTLINVQSAFLDSAFCISLHWTNLEANSSPTWTTITAHSTATWTKISSCKEVPCLLGDHSGYSWKYNVREYLRGERISWGFNSHLVVFNCSFSSTSGGVGPYFSHLSSTNDNTVWGWAFCFCVSSRKLMSL